MASRINKAVIQFGAKVDSVDYLVSRLSCTFAVATLRDTEGFAKAIAKSEAKDISEPINENRYLVVKSINAALDVPTTDPSHEKAEQISAALLDAKSCAPTKLFSEIAFSTPGILIFGDNLNFAIFVMREKRDTVVYFGGGN